MASIAALAGADLYQTTSKVASFLGIEEEGVAQLLKQGGLEGAILTTLQRKGLALQPSVKNSVQALVRAIEPKPSVSAPARAGSAPLQSDATATIMFTDVVGSSGLMERLGDRQGRLLLSKHDEIIRRQVAEHEGCEVKSLGDGFMFTFHSAGRAVAGAIAIQKAISEHNREQPEASIAIRIGVSVGEPIRDDNDMFGMSVIVAARIAAQAAGGQILISQIAHALTSSSGDFDVRPVGPVELKGVAGSHPLFEVVWSME